MIQNPVKHKELKSMKNDKILYSVCVEDVKRVLQAEFGIDFDKLTEAKQKDVIHYATKALQTIDWYQTLDVGLHNVIDEIKQGGIEFRVTVKCGSKAVLYNTFSKVSEAMQAQVRLNRDGIKSKIVKKIIPAMEQECIDKWECDCCGMILETKEFAAK